jgi:hypothetical protein
LEEKEQVNETLENEPQTAQCILEQVFKLEQLASTLASEGFDVTEASKELDSLRKKLQLVSVSGETKAKELGRMVAPNGAVSNDIQINVTLNRIRVMLAKVNRSRVYLHSPWPTMLFIYELLVLSGWAVLIYFSRSYIYWNYVEQDTWPLLLSLFPAAAVGSIASSTYALISLYRHIANRTLHNGISTWYIIKPGVGGIVGIFIGIIGSVLLDLVGASGNTAHAMFLGVAYLAGANPEFTEKLTLQFSQKVFGNIK